MFTLVLAGAVLRCWQPGDLAVEHFDEGVYASNLYSPDGAYPFRHLYSPPLFPALLEWVLILSGGAARSVIWVNVVVGCLTLPSVWWVTRTWFGPLAGISALTLAALSEMHMLYSRSALTDPLLCLLLLWSVYWGWKAILTGRPGAILLAGVFASLAWWTKYNGWLGLAIMGSGTAVWLITDRFAAHRRPLATHAKKLKCAKKQPMGPLIFRWTMIAFVTLAAWMLNVTTDLRQHGGFAAVSANHARYFLGLGGWWSGLVRQHENLAYLHGNLNSLLSYLLLSVVAAIGVMRCLFEVSPIRPLCAIAIGTAYAITLLMGVPFWLPFPTLDVMMAIATLLAFVWAGFTADRPTSLAAWLVGAWFVGLFLAVPLYTPYPRLALPWVMSAWIGTGLAVRIIRELWANRPPILSDEFPILSIYLCAVLFLGLMIAHAMTFNDRRSTGLPMQDIAADILKELPADENSAVIVLGEPGLYFHLANQSHNQNRLILPGGDFETLSPPDPSVGPVAMYVVYGPHVMRAADDPATGVSWAETNLTPVAEWDYQPSTLVLLNEYPPQAIKAGGVEPFVIRLGRVGE